MGWEFIIILKLFEMMVEEVRFGANVYLEQRPPFGLDTRSSVALDSKNTDCSPISDVLIVEVDFEDVGLGKLELLAVWVRKSSLVGLHQPCVFRALQYNKVDFVLL